MKNNSFNSGFVSISNIISEILLALDDVEKRRYYARALQLSLNIVRQVNVVYSKEYKEVPVSIDNDLKYGKYPMDLVKIISVGIYVNDQFWPFIHKGNMSKTVTGGVDDYLLDETGSYDTGEETGVSEGIGTYSESGNSLLLGYKTGYWVEDNENRRFFVRNYDKNKIILRYRSNGIDCTKDSCIPYVAKDLIVAMAVYDFAIKGIPRKFTAAELDALYRERSRIFDDYTSIEYEPQNMFEFTDAAFGSYSGFLGTSVTSGVGKAVPSADGAVLYDPIGTARNLMNIHEAAYDHSLIATALQPGDVLTEMGAGAKSSATDAGTLNQLSLTDDYLYICTATGVAGSATWKKTLLFAT